jgi:hypothetical protein
MAARTGVPLKPLVGREHVSLADSEAAGAVAGALANAIGESEELSAMVGESIAENENALLWRLVL